MKMKNKISFTALIILFIFSSCGMVIKSYIRKDTENVPPDFGKEKTTILVIQKYKSFNNKVEKILKSEYSGNYFFITKEELETKYSDKDKYRYILDDEIWISGGFVDVTTITKDRQTGYKSSRTETENRTAKGRSFNLQDRKENKKYDTGVDSGTSWKTILKAYLNKLDSERKKNGGH